MPHRDEVALILRERLIEHHGQTHPSLSEPPLNQFAANKLRTVDILHHPWPAGAALNILSVPASYDTRPPLSDKMSSGAFPKLVQCRLDLRGRDHVQALFSVWTGLPKPTRSTFDRAIEVDVPGIAGANRVNVSSIDHDGRCLDGGRNVHRTGVRGHEEVGGGDGGDQFR